MLWEPGKRQRGREREKASAKNVVQEIICLVFAWNKIRFEVYIKAAKLCIKKAAAAFSGCCARKKKKPKDEINSNHGFPQHNRSVCLFPPLVLSRVYNVMYILKYFVYEVPRKKLNSTHFTHTQKHTTNHLPSSSHSPPYARGKRSL